MTFAQPTDSFCGTDNTKAIERHKRCFIINAVTLPHPVSQDND